RLQAVQARLNEAQKQSFKLQLDIDKAKARIATHQASKKSVSAADIPEAAVHADLAAEPVRSRQLATLGSLQDLVARLEAAGHPAHDSTLVQARRRLEEVQKEIEAARAEIRTGLLQRRRQQVEADFARVQEELRSALPPLEDRAKKVQQEIYSLAGEAEAI